IEPVKKFARTVRSHRELLLNYSRARKEFSSGVIEALNNKAKVTMRKAYRYRTFRIAELSLIYFMYLESFPNQNSPRFLLTNLKKRPSPRSSGGGPFAAGTWLSRRGQRRGVLS